MKEFSQKQVEVLELVELGVFPKNCERTVSSLVRLGYVVATDLMYSVSVRDRFQTVMAITDKGRAALDAECASYDTSPVTP